MSREKESPHDSPDKTPRLWQFSLRHLVLGITSLCVLLATARSLGFLCTALLIVVAALGIAVALLRLADRTKNERLATGVLLSFCVLAVGFLIAVFAFTSYWPMESP